MVWFTNRSSGSVGVTITNKSGGSDSDYMLLPNTLEMRTTNHWNRKGDEEATIRLANGKNKQFKIKKDQYVIVYEDTIVLMEGQEILL
jgi:hypothetical protein